MSAAPGSPPASALPPDFPAAPEPLVPQSTHPEVELGNHRVPVLRQSLPYLFDHLGDTLTQFAEKSQEVSPEAFLTFIGGETYRVFSVLLPALPDRMPEHEWHGHHSRQAWEAKESVQVDNPGPDFPQIIEALQIVWRLNRFDVLGKAKDLIEKLVDPTQLKPVVTARIRREIATRGLPDRSSSPSPSGDTPPTRPSGPDRTSSESTGSPSPGSSSSPSTTSSDAKPS